MQQSDYEKEFDKIGVEAEKLAVEIEKKNYETFAELDRDIQRVLDLWQRGFDLMTEIFDEMRDCLPSDYVSPCEKI